MSLLIQYTFVFAAVLIMVALGGMFSERSGVINIGLEGIMVFGALGGAMTLHLLPEKRSSRAAFVAFACRSVHKFQSRPNPCRHRAQYDCARRGYCAC